MSVDAEIYIKQVYHFFDTNPDQLEMLIGQLNKDTFYLKIKDKVYEHVNSGSDELELTRQEMIDIIKEMFDEMNVKPPKEIPLPFMETKFGLVSLN